MKPGLDNSYYVDTGFDIDADLETDIVMHVYRDNHFVDAHFAYYCADADAYVDDYKFGWLC